MKRKESTNISRGPRIPGVLPSSRFGEQVVSTGIPSLDSYIGGGIPIGSICLLKDTYPCRYGDLVLKCFLAEGAVYNHDLYVASDKVSPKIFGDELPALKKKAGGNSEEQNEGNVNLNDHSLKIAWRYGVANPTTPGVVKGQKEAKFEFKKKTTVSSLGNSNLKTSEVLERKDLMPVKSLELLKEIAQSVAPFDVSNSSSSGPKKPVANLIRIGISHCEEQTLNAQFMMGLRALVRRTNSCAVITVSNCSPVSKSQELQAEQFVDYIIRLEVILEDKRKSELGDVDGICDVVKIASANTIKPNELPRDLGFSFRNKRLTFQELHIPPEGENTTQRESSSRSVNISSGSSCGATIRGKSIDF
ncbi:unnamed protein product [Allacma fusca]|uniref:Elongator complex protein 4 n=1 Tax=Allacma fusca TaxID=39272 RepID=A0A8J2M7T0_9HEXA|nr:unnamed protein product [Allacma fusca]